MADVIEILPTRDQIERRAYEIYLARGAQDGYDIADWAAAERELMELVLQTLSNWAVSSESSRQSNDVLMHEPQKADERRTLQITIRKGRAVAASQQAV